MNLPLAISIVVSVLATVGAAAALHHLGRDQRQFKNHDGHLELPFCGPRVAVVVAAVLVLLVAGGAWYRVWTEGVLSGLADLALLLALLVATVMLVSAWLVFWTAFRDGSPERDDLAYYTRLLRHPLKVKQRYEQQAEDLRAEIELLQDGSAATSWIRIDIVGDDKDGPGPEAPAAIPRPEEQG